MASLSTMSRRGMTLLEVLLAAAVLASVALLAAMLLAQGRAWNDDNQSHFKALRLVRVTELLTRQWSDRRSAVGVDASGGKVRIEPESLVFVTATPVLHPGWPLVTASYRVEKEPGTGLTRLAYEEARVSRFGTQGDAAEAQLESPATGDEKPLRTVLLSGVKDLRFERYGPRLSAEQFAAALDRGDLSASDHDEDGARRPGWWRFDAAYKGPVPAVRLVGTLEGKEFTCVFVVERSR